jgi:Predicted unusual protein kinase
LVESPRGGEGGGGIEDFFQEGEESPFAVFFFAQVHKGTLKDNSKKVVIKILRAGIRREVERNVSLLKSFGSIFSITFKDSERVKPLEVVRDYEKNIIKELDLKLEGSNTNFTRKNFSGSKILYILEVFWDLSTSKMLVLEEIEGIFCTDIDKIDAAGVDKKKLAENGV